MPTQVEKIKAWDAKYEPMAREAWPVLENSILRYGNLSEGGELGLEFEPREQEEAPEWFLSLKTDSAARARYLTYVLVIELGQDDPRSQKAIALLRDYYTNVGSNNDPTYGQKMVDECVEIALAFKETVKTQPVGPKKWTMALGKKTGHEL